LERHSFNLETRASVPSILLANTTWWPCASRLAIALTRVGCDVSAIYPVNGHPLVQTSVIRQRYPYRSLHPVNSLADAIRQAKPHLVVPCDDRAVEHLHQLHAQECCGPANDVCRLIERSLGPPASYPVVSARYPLLTLASAQGLPVPDTAVTGAGAPFDAWARSHRFPWVLKADGTWGGHGTRIVATQQEAEKLVRRMTQPLGASRALKRLVADRDPFWILPWRNHSTSQVVVQSYVQGSAANCAVVCWEGKVLAGIAAEVICAQGETGSATIIRVVDSPEMMCAAERLAAHLGLSGFFGLDFVIEASTGKPYLIEMNPRLTPLCHLQLGAGRDLVSAITAQLTGEPLTVLPSLVPSDHIAYFPQAWHWDRTSDLLWNSFHDVPWEEPLLVQELLRLPWPVRSLPARLSAGLRALAPGKTNSRHPASPAPAESANGVASNGNSKHLWKLPAVVPLRQNGSRQPLFLIPGVDGQVSRFYTLTRHLERDQPVYGVLSQGLLRERAALTRVEQLASYYLKQIRAVQPRGPYHLLGFSFGGHLAFEIARQLHLDGEVEGMVGLVDTQFMRADTHPAELDGLPKPAGGPAKHGSSVAVFHAKRVLQPGGLRYAKDKLRARGLRTIYSCLDSAGLPIPAFLQSAPDLGWFAAVRFEPQPFPGKLTLFNTAGSPERTGAAYELWSRLTGRNIELHEIAGRHEDIFDEPNVQSLAVALTACLAKLQ
jgi:thioesterase domain-containing protein